MGCGNLIKIEVIGRTAYEAKLGRVSDEAHASSPLTGFLEV